MHKVNVPGVQHIVFPCSSSDPGQQLSKACCLYGAPIMGLHGLQQQLAAIKGCTMPDLCLNPHDMSAMQTLHVIVATLNSATSLEWEYSPTPFSSNLMLHDGGMHAQRLVRCRLNVWLAQGRCAGLTMYSSV